MKKRQEPTKHSVNVTDDIHFAFGGDMLDPAAWGESIETVAVRDREWLRKHPEKEYRRRLIAPLEMRATGLPPTTEVFVSRGPHGSQVRAFRPPTKVASVLDRNISSN